MHRKMYKELRKLILNKIDVVKTVDVITRGQKKHNKLQITTKDGRSLSFSVAKTPSDHRNFLNLVSQMRHELSAA